MEDIYVEFKAFEEKMKSFHLPRTKDLPGIDLYMDQVVSVVVNALSPLEIDGRTDFLTSAMINNYVKQGLLFSPKNKKYSKAQVCFLIVICILKRVYAINEIKTLLTTAAAGKDRDELRATYHSFCEHIENALRSATMPSATIRWEEEVESPFGKVLATSIATKIYMQKIVSLKTRLLEGEEKIEKKPE